MQTEPRTTVRPALLMVFVLVGWLHSGAARADSGTDRKPFEAVIVELKAVDDEKVAAWKKEGFRAIVLVVDEHHEAAVLKKAANAVAAGSLDLYYWIEIGRNPAMAKEHPQWMASLGGHHDDWRKRFPDVRKLQEGEVAKVWPWVPIGYREAFDAHLAKVTLLIEKIPAGYRGLLLNDLQGGPSSCGCGNLQCRWAMDYGGASTATKLGGADTAAKFVAAVRKLAKDKEVIPVWTTECGHEDLSPERQRPKGGWSTGYCGSVDCFGTCTKKFTEQWTALLEGQRGPVGVLALHKEFQRDRKEYGDSADWISHVVNYLDKVKPVVSRERTWLVVQGYDLSAEVEAAARRAAAKTGAGAVLVARARLDQSYEPRIVKEMDELELFSADKIKWQEGPPSLPKGVMIAVLEGDPTKEGPFVFRLKLPDGYRVPPHTHPKTERITVLAGTFNVGMGDKFDEKAGKAMTAGTYGHWSAGMKHFVWAKGETILQYHGSGPWTIQYVNPEDDPRKQKK